MTATSTPCWACGQPAGPVEHFLPGVTHRCGHCGLVFQPERSAETERDSYDSDYFDDYAGEGSYTDEDGRREYEARRRLARVRGHVRTGRLIEVGPAEGHFLLAAREAGFDVVGVEAAESAAQAARRRAGVDVRVGFVEDVELEPDTYDAACAFHVVEHIPDPLPAMRRLAGALRHGGMLFIEVPNAQSHAAAREDWPYWIPEYHVAHYGPRSMRALLERAGLEPVAVDSFPATAYYPPRIALAPGQLYSYVRESLKLRALPRRPHPIKHDLLRAIARRR